MLLSLAYVAVRRPLRLLTARDRDDAACDFCCVETVWLKTVYVLFFVELSTRRAYLADVTAHPNSAWVTQQARN